MQPDLTEGVTRAGGKSADARMRAISMKMAKEFEDAVKVSDGPATPRAAGDGGVAFAAEFLETCDHRGSLEWWLDGAWCPVFAAVKDLHLYLFKGADETMALQSDPTHIINLRLTIADPTVFEGTDSVFPKEGKEHCFTLHNAAQGTKCTLAAPTAPAANRWCNVLLDALKQRTDGAAAKSINIKSGEDTADARALQIFKDSLPQNEQVLLGRDYFHSDVSLMRILELKKGDTKKAREAFLSTALWRKQMGLDTMTIAHVVDKASKGAFITPGIYDVEGRPVILIMSREQMPGPDSTLHLSKCLTYALEQATRLFKPDGPYEATIVCNLTGVKMTQFDERFQRIALEVFTQRFPGVPSLGIFYNVPPFIRWFLKVITSIAPKWMRQRFHFFKGSASSIAPFVKLEDLPNQYFGGQNSELTCETYIAERAAKEGITIGADMRPIKQDLDPAIAAQLKSLYCGAKDLPDVLKAGWMSKQGGAIKNWKKRYLVLRPGILYYFKGEDAVEPQGMVLLENATAEEGTKSNSAGKENAMLVHTPLRTYIIVLASAAERDDWIHAVSAQCYVYDG